MLQGIKIARTDNEVKNILLSSKAIAIVGSSPSIEKDSHKITRYLNDKNYTIYPVNPGYEEILGLKCFHTLEEIPEPINIVDVFRRPESAAEVVKDAVSVNAKVIWFQLGVGTDEAVRSAIENNLTVVDNKCIKVEHMRLL